jgi:hypothetical protein
LFPIAALLAAATLQGCAVAPDIAPTYDALERGFRWQCQASAEQDSCVHHKFLALQERRRDAPAPQAIDCRKVFGTTTCTIAEENE